MRGGLRSSAIDKQPAGDPVAIGPLGLAGDEQAEKRFHGGPRKAVYAYALEDLAWWSAELGRPLPPGFIGENLTTAGIDLNALHVDDELHVGEVVLRVTEPRDPCAKLAARIGLRGFEKRFGRAARTGVYCSVVVAGTVRAGDPVTVVAAANGGSSIRELVRARYGEMEDLRGSGKRRK
jgi:MOSC domain-containing protein YiiM